MATKEEILKNIGTLDLEPAVKEILIGKVTALPEDASPAELVGAALDELQNQIESRQGEIDKAYSENGVTIDENDPEYKKAFDEMEAEVTAANQEFQEGMQQVEKEAGEIVEETNTAAADALAADLKS